MFRPKTSVYLLASMVLAVAALSACSSQNASEENLVRQFFRASGLRDSQTLANFATVSFDPKTEGSVNDFEVTAVSPERTRAASRHRAGQGRHRGRRGEQGVQREEKGVSGRECRGHRSRAESRKRRPQADGQGRADSSRVDEVARRQQCGSEESVGGASSPLRCASDRGVEPHGQLRIAYADGRRARRHARVEGHLGDGDGARRGRRQRARRTT